MSHLTFVAVPGGRTASGDGLLRLLVVPTLDTGGSLAAEGMSTWPPPELTSPEASLRVEVGTRPTAAPTATIDARPFLNVVPDLWQRFFGTIDVHTPGEAVSRTMDVQPTNAQAAGIIAAYRDAARELTSEEARPAFEATSRARAGELAGLDTLPLPQPGVGTPSERPVDFHLATSILREHPAVLRSLGLILDLTLPATAISSSQPGEGVVRVTWPGAPAGVPEIRPRWTRFSPSRFLAAPGPQSDLHPAGGMVALARQSGGERIWRLHTVDVDHALRGLAAAAVADADGRLPALRTVGVLLARAGRTLELAGRQGRTGRSPEEELLADHLTLGYRVDARILGGEWHSLTRRRSTYIVNGVEFVSGLREEGHVKVGGGVDRGDQVLRTDEVVARWDGWSLAVPRPAMRERPATATAPATDLPFTLDTSGIEVEPGSLLKLRFGEDYQLRARVADVAGGGPELDEPSLDGCDSETVRFRRLEPVLPPEVRTPDPAEPFGPGAGPSSLVVRTAEGMPDTLADTTRGLLPPTATFEVVERHGRFDGDPKVTSRLLARTDLPDPAAGGVVGFISGMPGEPPRDLEPQDWTSSAADAPEDPWPDLKHKRLVLRARNGDEPTLEWESDDLLVVRLSPAEEATLEISSLIDQAAKSAFAISDWIAEGDAVDAAEALLADGRHPMATPAHRLSVRHAVRAPRGTPDGALEALRDKGATWTLLMPDGDPMVGIDPASTVSVEVTASWTPVDDTEDPPVTGRPVGRIAIGRAEQLLPSVRHELGDTKHRIVDYTLTALSRFRDCFPATDAEALFRTEGVIRGVDVRSSARPVVPVVRSVAPAFVWREERRGSSVVRTRLGNRLRVELAAPWFMTGDGEQLAVLCAQGTPADEVLELVTQAGRDPLWLPGVPPRFPTPLGMTEEVELAEGPRVRMVGHGVFQAAGSAFADVTFEQSAAYSPLVQLAVARYQPSSLEGLSISPVVRTDFVPLLPDRTLTVTPGSGQVTVRLEGHSPTQPRLNRVDVVAEQRVTADGALPVASVTLGEDAVWQLLRFVSGRVGEELVLPLPEGLQGARVRVREVEMIGRDTSPVLGSAGELDERVVFTDTVELEAD